MKNYLLIALAFIIIGNPVVYAYLTQDQINLFNAQFNMDNSQIADDQIVIDHDNNEISIKQADILRQQSEISNKEADILLQQNIIQSGEAYVAYNSPSSTNVNWDYVASELGQGVNWQSVKSSLTDINWTAVSEQMNVNWQSINWSGINWNNWPIAESNGENWAQFIVNGN